MYREQIIHPAKAIRDLRFGRYFTMIIRVCGRIDGHVQQETQYGKNNRRYTCIISPYVITLKNTDICIVHL